MIRVIVESPFAPRTPQFAEICPWEKDGLLGCYNVGSPGSPHDQYRPCPRCAVDNVRASESAQHARYLAAALRDCVLRGEAPFASHGLYTLPGVLRDEVPEERAQGIAAGFVWREVAHMSAFYVDLGWSSGMKHGEEDAKKLIDAQWAPWRQSNTPPTLVHRLDYRTLGPDWDRK